MNITKTAVYGLATAALTLALVLSAAVSVHAQTTGSSTTNTGTNVTNSATTGTTSTTGTTGTVGLPNTGAGGFTGANMTAIILSAIAVAFGIRLAYRQYSEQ